MSLKMFQKYENRKKVYLGITILLTLVVLSGQVRQVGSLNAYKRGKLCGIAGQPAEAIKELTTAIVLNPRFAEAYLERGIVYFEQKDYDKSLLDVTTALRLNPQLRQAYGTLGMAQRLAAQKLLDQSIVNLTEALNEHPRNSRALLGRGYAYLFRGFERDFTHAIEDLTRFLKMNPKSKMAYHYRGWVYLNDYEWERAVSDLTQAIALAPKPDADVYGLRAIAYEKLGKAELAEADYSRVIHLNPKRASGFLDRGCFYLGQNSLDKALMDLNQAIKLAPRLSKAYFMRAKVHLAQTHTDQAALDSRKAYDLGWDVPEEFIASVKKVPEKAK